MAPSRITPPGASEVSYGSEPTRIKIESTATAIGEVLGELERYAADGMTEEGRALVAPAD
jgi:hypothetical protein